MRGQAGLEALITVAVVFMIVLFTYLFVINPNAESARDSRHSLGAGSVCNTISNSILLATQSGNGFRTRFSIPARLDDAVSFNASAYKTYLQVSYDNSSVFCPIQAGRLRLELNPPRNTSLAYLVREPCLYDYLQQYDPLVYCSTSYQQTCPTSDPCQSMTSQQRNVSYNNFLIGLKNDSFHFVILEDPHLAGPGLNYSEDYVYRGGTLYASEHWTDTGNLFGATFTSSASSDTLNVTSVSEFLPGVHVGDQIQVKDKTYDISGPNVQPIAVYSDGATGIAKVTYGAGTLFYAPDYNGTILNRGIIYDQSVANGINSTYLDLGVYSGTPFQLNRTVYEVLNSNETIIVRVIE